MAKCFNEKLIDLLKTDSRFVDDEGELVKAAVIDRAWKIDRDLVKLLLSEPDIKKKFFDEIEKHWIFNINTFIEYISDKNFLANSYTRFRNKIGLNIEGKFLRERGEVSLVWPYKDCVLEGGQTKEKEKRKEIFFNEILAQDEIDRLFDPKVITNWKRYSAEGEQKLKEIKRDENGTIKENLIINGNNLLALHTLKTQFRSKVKLIYIDPPFNTGSDSFNYNDTFNHSSWLTFMMNRLQIAKQLLAPNGVICIHVGNEEISYLQIIMDEVFGTENYLNHISMTTNDPSGFKATSSKIFSTANHLLIYSRRPEGEKINKLYVKKQYDEAYKYVLLNPQDNYTEWQYSTIIERLATLAKAEGVKEYKKTISKHELLEKIEDFAYKNKTVVFRTAAIGGGALAKRKDTVGKSKENKNKVFQHPGEDVEGFYILNGEQILFWANTYREVDGELVPSISITDIWTDIGWTGIANEGGVKLKNGKKPEKLLKRIIELCSQQNDIILDFFAGSGTTLAVSHKLDRQYIGIEQIEYDKNDSIVRLTNVINGDQSGISKSVNWQGGGEFIYCELKKYNEAFMDKIQVAKTSNKLVKLWKEIAESSFLNWYVNPETPDEAVNDFIEIGKTENGIEKQKKLLAELLNKNQLYVNLSEIDDSDFNVSDEDKKLNQSFYGEAYNG